MTQTRADDYGQADDAVWTAAWADTARRPYMISGSTGGALHTRRDCGHVGAEYGSMAPGGPWPVPEYAPRPVFLTAEEAAAFLAGAARRHVCGTCARLAPWRIQQGRTVPRPNQYGPGRPPLPAADEPAPGPDADLTAILDAAADLGPRLATWQARAEPDAHARRAASAAIAAIDTALGALYRVRGRLIAETRAADDANAARVDNLLAARKAEAEEHTDDEP